MLDIIKETWSWWASGILIAGIMFLLLFFGQSFGFSSNLRTICSAAGCGKSVQFFDFNWRSQIWNLVFLVGAILGGFLAREFLSTDEPINISGSTIADIAKLGFGSPETIQPAEL
ncbi:MAG: YeeE/YedE family protein, partial [Kaistella sp.]